MEDGINIGYDLTIQHTVTSVTSTVTAAVDKSDIQKKFIDSAPNFLNFS